MWDTLVKWKGQDEEEYKKTMLGVTLFVSIPSTIIGIVIGFSLACM